VHCYRLDLGAPTTLDARLADILDGHRPVPYLINNAGVHVEAPVEELGDDALRRSFQVNAVAPLTILQAVLPDLRALGFGRVVNVTSGAPLNCAPGYAAYSASKGALNGLTRTAAKEYADRNIKINLMSPGPVRTEMAPDAPMEPSACHATVDHLLALGDEGPTGRFFWLGYELPLTPDLRGVQWLEGTASDEYKQVV
jgi:NAD(P)-dependent dehydrogenase (short-subunit alcohol dehydrogenase family)